MRPRRRLDGRILLAVAAVLALAAVVDLRQIARPTRPSVAEAIGLPLLPASPFDPTAVVDAPARPGPGAGTAFSVARGGVWLTARHVVEGCGKVAVVVAPGRGVAADVRLDPAGETAVLVTRGGAPALPIAPWRLLRRGAPAFHPGFPDGRPGEAASRLIGRETLWLRGAGRRRERTLAWREVGHTAGLPPSLAGLSGAPALDSAGEVVGVTIAQSPRRGRLFTTTPGALRTALRHAGVQLDAATDTNPINLANYERAASDMRRALSVAQVVCLAS